MAIINFLICEDIRACIDNNWRAISVKVFSTTRLREALHYFSYKLLFVATVKLSCPKYHAERFIYFSQNSTCFAFPPLFFFLRRIIDFAWERNIFLAMRISWQENFNINACHTFMHSYINTYLLAIIRTASCSFLPPFRLLRLCCAAAAHLLLLSVN